LLNLEKEEPYLEGQIKLCELSASAKNVHDPNQYKDWPVVMFTSSVVDPTRFMQQNQAARTIIFHIYEKIRRKKI